MSKKKSAPVAKVEPKSETPDEKFERVSARVVKAVEELNEALKEAHGESNMTVGFTITGSDNKHARWPWKPESPALFTYHIGRITKCSMALAVYEMKAE